MIRTTYKTALIKQKTAYIKTCECDKCKKVIYRRPQGDFPELKDIVKPFNGYDVSYYEVTTGHHDWGNDSCDSINHFHVCPSCLIKLYSSYVDRASGVDNTEYIKIEHHNTYSWDIDIPLAGEDIEEVTDDEYN